MSKIDRFLFRFWHRHDYRQLVSCKVQGATLAWDGRIAPAYAITRACNCGKRITESGMILPLKPFKRDASGWPLHDDGTRMGIYKP